MPTAAGVFRPPFSLRMAESGKIANVRHRHSGQKNRRTGRGAAVGEAASMQERRLKTRTAKDADGTDRTVHDTHHAARSAAEPASPAVETVAKVGKKRGTHHGGFAGWSGAHSHAYSHAHSHANPQRPHHHSVRAPNTRISAQEGKSRRPPGMGFGFAARAEQRAK